jgi:hypothetical protein
MCESAMNFLRLLQKRENGGSFTAQSVYQLDLLPFQMLAAVVHQ